MNEENETL